MRWTVARPSPEPSALRREERVEDRAPATRGNPDARVHHAISDPPVGRPPRPRFGPAEGALLRHPAPCARRCRLDRSVPPSGIASAALRTRFQSTWRSWAGSAVDPSARAADPARPSTRRARGLEHLDDLDGAPQEDGPRVAAARPRVLQEVGDQLVQAVRLATTMSMTLDSLLGGPAGCRRLSIWIEPEIAARGCGSRGRCSPTAPTAARRSERRSSPPSRPRPSRPGRSRRGPLGDRRPRRPSARRPDPRWSSSPAGSDTGSACGPREPPASLPRREHRRCPPGRTSSTSRPRAPRPNGRPGDPLRLGVEGRDPPARSVVSRPLIRLSTVRWCRSFAAGEGRSLASLVQARPVRSSSAARKLARSATSRAPVCTVQVVSSRAAGSGGADPQPPPSPLPASSTPP